ncbi:MAG: alpha/beta hydrolase [Porphyromonas sp.]|nr:alpha/beta hydrolase [Porphyromonas sp.]
MEQKAKYKRDILGGKFKQLQVSMPEDYEGEVMTTLVRRKCTGSSQKAVLYIHGFNDYFFQTEMAERFCSHGYNFYAVDLRKYGRSWKPHQLFNNVRDLREYDEDISWALGQIQKEGNRKVLLCGHSTGGLLVTYYSLRYPDSELFHALFCNSPFYGFQVGPLAQKVLPVVSKLGSRYPELPLPVVPFTDFYGKALHISERGEWNYNLNLKPHVPSDTKLAFISAVEQAHRYLDEHTEIKVPMLVMCSDKSFTPVQWDDKIKTSDIILNVEHIRDYTKRLRGDITFSSVKDGIHDLVLSQKEVREEVYDKLFRWCSRVMPR